MSPAPVMTKSVNLTKAMGARMMASAPWKASAGKFQIQTFNAISQVGLGRFPADEFVMTGSSGGLPDGVADEPHSILIRSHKLKPEEVASSVRAIARCGAGTNNIPVEEMTARGIPVFNTPGSNANAVKELVVCGMLLSSRGIVEGINHTKNVICAEEPDHKSIAARIEKDKKLFVGQELRRKVLGVAGLGNIGASVAEAAIGLGMEVVGYDPAITVETAWRLPNSIQRVNNLEDLFARSDYISLNMPYIKDVTHHVVDGRVLSKMKPTCHLLNFARGELVDSKALKAMYEKGHKGRYIADFADEYMKDEPHFMCIPHLGASTEEAEENSAWMAADQVVKFLETGTIRNSVNFPTTHLDRQSSEDTRLCVITENKPGMLGEITTMLGQEGINISQQINTSRGAIAYNVVDCQGMEKLHESIQTALGQIPGVLSSRIIWAGTATEGPASFYAY